MPKHAHGRTRKSTGSTSKFWDRRLPVYAPEEPALSLEEIWAKYVLPKQEDIFGVNPSKR